MTKQNDNQAGERTHFMFAPIRKEGDPTLPVWSDTPLPEVARAGFEPSPAGLAMFNSLHNRKAFNLYANKDGNWYVVYMPLHGIHPSFGYGSEANRLVRLALKTELAS